MKDPKYSKEKKKLQQKESKEGIGVESQEMSDEEIRANLKRGGKYDPTDFQVNTFDFVKTMK